MGLCRVFDLGDAYKGKKFDGVYLARREDDDLIYAGKLENGFTLASQHNLEARAINLRTPIQPLTDKIKKPKAHSQSTL